MMYKKKVNKNNRRIVMCGCVLSVLLIITQCFRFSIKPFPNGLNPGLINTLFFYLFFIILGIIVFIFFLKFTFYQYKSISKFKNSQFRLIYQRNDLIYYFVCAFAQFLGWGPVFLAYFPGIFAYDVLGQIPMEMGSYNNWHPLAHTLYLKFFYNILGVNIFRNPNIGIALCTITQMVLFALLLSNIHLFLRRTNLNLRYRLFWIIFFMFAPFLSMLSISLTKDVFFTGFFINVLINICYMELDPYWIQNRKNLLVFLISVCGMILFRNTAIYIWIIFIIIATFYWVKYKQYFFPIILVFSLCLGLLLNNGLLFILKAEKVKYNDAFAVPLQQIGYVYNNSKNDMEQSLKKRIKFLIPDIDRFYPYSADYLKPSSKLVKEHFSEYKMVYSKLLLRYPGKMLYSFMLLNQGYWYLNDKSIVNIYENKPGFGYFLTFTFDGFGVKNTSLFPELKDFFERQFEYPNYSYQKNPFLFILCSLAIYFWILLFCLFSAIGSKTKIAFLPLLLVFILIGTVFLGPCVLVRYALPYIISIPIILRITFNGSVKRKERIRYQKK